MNLFITITKAIGATPNTSVDSQSGQQASRAYKESFNTVHAGVTGGDASPDDPGVGKQWKSSDKASLDDELEEDRQRDNEVAQKRGIVAKPNEDKPDDAKKALDILKSFNSTLTSALREHMPNEREVEYLVHECGYSQDDVVKGYARIAGHERSAFNTWLNNRFRTCADRLVSR